MVSRWNRYTSHGRLRTKLQQHPPERLRQNPQTHILRGNIFVKHRRFNLLRSNIQQRFKMNGLPTLGSQTNSLRQDTVERTRELALQKLEEECRLAKENIHLMQDLRVLNSIIKRINTLNHPRGSINRP